ncbi:MauE/DoxX family redox-associated membrane protein [Myroides odoratus]|uniref:Methylamine utilisation protein MauE domain-containing protein n=1 Tax=Myroides odoratus TaxID=256 RepID=A0A378RIP6_MYROD|nr:MauE/DoxX family redox-associated membrane protein [Myroides odoratus]QQU02176.1 hypothetical protein I6I89_09850 [Myroides odoratus]STZ26916.1 Uncharacterised protein [Myroides odoratus]
MKAKYVLIISYFYILLFVYAAISKLITFEAFQVQLTQSPLLSAYANIIAYLVLGAELLFALLLCTKTTRLLGLYLSYGLMVAFTLYIYLILNYSDFIPCSCGGILEKMGWNEHLWFNIIVSLLALIALFLDDRGKLKIIVFKLMILTVFSFVIVLLVLNLDKEVVINNKIERFYKEFILERNEVVELDYNSYYIAGITDDNIVLANYTAPKHLLLYSINDNSLIQSSIILNDSLVQRIKNLKLTLQGKHFYLYDNTSSTVLWGNTQDWEVKNICHFNSVFNSFIMYEDGKAIVRLYNSQQRTNMLGKIDLEICSIDTISDVLNKKIDGLFDIDGQLLRDIKNNNVVYLFYYRNQYLNFELGNITKPLLQHTIDTMAQVPLTFGVTENGNKKKLSKSFFKVNVNGTYFNNHLFIKSNTIGKDESAKRIKNFSIYDVYHVQENVYKFSFYMENYKGKEMKSLFLYNDLLMGITEDNLIIYQLDLSYL